MRRGALILFGAFISIPLFAQASSADLIENAKAHDGELLTFSGELIGDPMPRGDHLWVNVSDGAGALGVWLPRVLFTAGRSFGSYYQRGDRVRVSGIFNRSCREHGGDMDIHATALVVEAAGERVSHPLALPRMIAACGLLLTSAGAFLLWRKAESKGGA